MPGHHAFEIAGTEFEASNRRMWDDFLDREVERTRDLAAITQQGGLHALPWQAPGGGRGPVPPLAEDVSAPIIRPSGKVRAGGWNRGPALLPAERTVISGLLFCLDKRPPQAGESGGASGHRRGVPGRDVIVEYYVYRYRRGVSPFNI